MFVTLNRGVELSSAMVSHALLIPFPLQGHINPMMQLAWKLVSNGFLITFLNSDSNHNRILKANTPNYMHDNIRMISVPFEFPAMGTLEGIENGMEAVEKGMGPSVIDKLIQEINAREEEKKVTCIIADAWMCFGLDSVATLHNIPLAAFHTALVSFFAIYHSSAALVSLGTLPSDGILKEDKTVNFLSSMPPLHSRDLPWLWGGKYIFRKGIRMAEEIKQIKWVLFNSFSEIEAPVVEELSKEVGVYPIGPLIPSELLHSRTSSKILPSLWKNETECLQWLDKQSTHSVIYISFGSITVLNEKQLEELALGLEATGRPFLWVLRSDLMNGSEAILPAGFMERVRDIRGCIVSWAPQLEVLSHSSIACFVTHCGWNSVQESIAMGVPMLCWPYFADQFLNRTYVVDVWKLGLTLNANSQGIIEKGEFLKCVESLLGSEQGLDIREVASNLKRMARDAIKDRGSSSNSLNLFLTDIKSTV